VLFLALRRYNNTTLNDTDNSGGKTAVYTRTGQNGSLRKLRISRRRLGAVRLRRCATAVEGALGAVAYL